MKLNISSTSMQTSFSMKTKPTHEKILSEMDNYSAVPDLDSSKPPSPSISNGRIHRFFPSNKGSLDNLSETSKLPSLKFKIATQVNHAGPARKIAKHPTRYASCNNIPIVQKTLETSNLADELILQPKSDEFFRFNKNSARIEQLSELNNNKPNIYMKLNKIMEQENIMPRKLQLLDVEQSKEVKANGQLQSTKYVKMFAEGISSNSYNQLRKLNLNSNSLSNQNFSIIASKLPDSVQQLDLKNNKLTRDGAQIITQIIRRPKQFLMELNLENNFIGDSGFTLLLNSLSVNQGLRILNVSRNQIEDTSMEALGRIIKKNNTLLELYLHYNKITHRGGVHFFQGLQKNTILKVLDVSFNRLGGDYECTKAICNVISRPHPELIHLDLSHNKFTEENSKQIATDLAFNRIIYGFHFEGNVGFNVNTRGFLIKDIEQQQVLTKTEDINVEDQSKLLIEAQLQNLEIHKQKSLRSEPMRIDSVNMVNGVEQICWICQGWVECEFHWKINKSGSLNHEPVYIHFEFENYRPTLMNDNNDGFVLYRMCPPRQLIRYFFSNPIMNAQVYAKDQKTTQTQLHSPLRNFGVQLSYANGTTHQSEPMHTVNFIQTGDPLQIFDRNKHYLPKVLCKPREPERIVEIDPDLARKRVWTLDTSIFRDFEADTDAHLEQCLEFDLEASKIAKHIISKLEINQLKDTLKKYYKYIIQFYKHQCSISLEYDFPRITLNVIQAFFQQSKALQGMKQVDWEISLISTMVIRDNPRQYMQERCLVRHQFVELVVRLAKEVHIRNGNMKSLPAAVDKVMNGYLSFIVDFGSSQSWRDERFWTQIMDLTIRHKMPLLKALFNYCYINSAKNSLTKEKFISLNDFKVMFHQADIYPDHLTESDIYFIYLQSMMTQVDELQNSRHFEMLFTEFIEALARVAEKLSPNSPHYKDRYLNSKLRRTLHLYIKFEGLLYILYYRLKIKVDSNLADKSVLHGHEAKKLGIFLNHQEEEDDEDIYNQEPYQIIQRLLYEDEQRVSVRDNHSSGSKKGSVHRSDSFKNNNNNWAKVRALAKKNTIQSSNILQQLKLAQIENEMDEKLEFEESTPLARMKIENRRVQKSRYTINFDGPHYKFDLQE